VVVVRGGGGFSGGISYRGRAVVSGGPVTQIFRPPQEIILSTQRPAVQVFHPPRVVYRSAPTHVVYTSAPARVVRTVVYTPPAVKRGNLPFTGVRTVLGLIVGFALVCSGGLLLVRRRDEVEQALEQQAAALRSLSR